MRRYLSKMTYELKLLLLIACLVYSFNVIEGRDLGKEEEDNLYFIGSQDGFIHAYKADLETLKWKISLGNPLIESHLYLQNATLDNSNILPGEDGALYLANLEENTVEKIGISIKTLIDQSPFTLKNMSNSIFLGDKFSTAFVIDVEEGMVLSKVSSNCTEFRARSHHPLERSNRNLITVVRTDYTLKAFIQNTSSLLWNVTVAEVLVLDKGGKSEITYEEYYQYKKTKGKKNEIETLQRNLQEKMGSIVSIHKYKNNQNLPIKISLNSVDGNKESNMDENHLPRCKQTEKVKAYFRELMLKTKQNTKFVLFVKSDYINVYTLLILVLSIICSVTVYFFIKTYQDNIKLHIQIEEMKKERENMDSLSVQSTNSKLEKSNDWRVLKDTNDNNYATINNNFEGTYENYDTVDVEKVFVDNNSFVSSYNKLHPDKDYKMEEACLENSSNYTLRSQRSQRSKASIKSKCKYEAISTEEEFNNKTQIPFLQETFQIKHKKTDMSSVTECYVEENENTIKKTEVRKIVTLYDKKNETARSTEDPSPNMMDQVALINEMNHTIKRTKINVNTMLTKDNLKVCWETTNFNSVGTEIDHTDIPYQDYEENVVKSNSQNIVIDTSAFLDMDFFCPEEKVKKRFNSDINHYSTFKDKKVNKHQHQEEFVLKKAYKEELNQLLENYKVFNKEKLGLSRINSSVLLKQDVSITQKHMEILKMINELSEEDDDSYATSNANSKSEVFTDYSKINKDIFDTGRFLKNFEEIAMIGKGGFGCVFKARHKIDGSEYAIKIIKLKIGANESLSDQEVVKEIKTMMKLHDRNVVRYITCWFELNEFQTNFKNRSKSVNDEPTSFNKLRRIISQSKSRSNFIKDENDSESSSQSKSYYDYEIDSYKDSKIVFAYDNKEEATEEKPVVKDDTRLKLSSHRLKFDSEPKFPVYFYMQIEYCKGFPLSYYLEHRQAVTEDNLIFFIFKQILSAVDHIHNHNIIHRDLKPANIFIHDVFLIKIGDFGLATDTNRSLFDLKENVGTPLYQSPEQIEGKPYNEKVDIYSLGIILLELCTLFKTQSERRFVLENVRKNGAMPNSILEKYPMKYNLIKMMTDKNPNNRPSTQELLNSCEYKKMVFTYESYETEE